MGRQHWDLESIAVNSILQSQCKSEFRPVVICILLPQRVEPGCFSLFTARHIGSAVPGARHRLYNQAEAHLPAAINKAARPSLPYRPLRPLHPTPPAAGRHLPGPRRSFTAAICRWASGWSILVGAPPRPPPVSAATGHDGNREVEAREMTDT
ncbi:hypothetical protein E2C01_034665 [Portunus trituberculatus]|uniref:Uncharacterized protein n=1 Tax=Portunus trituberculatus TaxID=210409 RepID=A0A5B7F3E8_PORTR|nr:hypothetical protein [Portunus trituberculatus]